MWTRNTAKIAGLALLACIGLVAAAAAQTTRSNTLESLRSAYDTAVVRIAADIQRQKDDALDQYGKMLGVALASLKQKGDIDGYAVVEQETKRFLAEKTVSTNDPSVCIVAAAGAYMKQVLAADLDSRRRTALLLKQYIAALTGFIKDAMARDKFDEAKAAGDVRHSAEFLLAEFEAGVTSPKTATTERPPERLVVDEKHKPDVQQPERLASNVEPPRPAEQEAKPPVVEPPRATAPEVKPLMVVQAHPVPTTGKTLTVDLGGGVQLELVWIPPGEFEMGLPAAEDPGGRMPQHHVRLSKGFWIGKYEVTQKQWVRIMGANPAEFVSDQNPVERVSWDDCQTFVSKLNERTELASQQGRFRLPTEAEWEYACRAGTTTRFYTGDSEADLARAAWYGGPGGNSCQMTHPVGLKQPNAWGLYDMLGNVGEWCQDSGGPLAKEPVTDPIGPVEAKTRAFRTSSWRQGPVKAQSAFRFGFTSAHVDREIGFRVVCSH